MFTLENPIARNHNPRVGGSSPSFATTFLTWVVTVRVRASVCAHLNEIPRYFLRVARNFLVPYSHSQSGQTPGERAVKTRIQSPGEDPAQETQIRCGSSASIQT